VARCVRSSFRCQARLLRGRADGEFLQPFTGSEPYQTLVLDIIRERHLKTVTLEDDWCGTKGRNRVVRPTPRTA
jgi:hypothetical protein